MYKGKEDWIGNHIYACPKCKKMMGDNPDTISLHNKKYCQTKRKKSKNATKK